MHLELLEHCGLKVDSVRNEFFLPADALDAARNFFAANKIVPEKPTIFLQPFTSSAAKNWPLENYLAVARHWRAHGWQIFSAAVRRMRRAGTGAGIGFCDFRRRAAARHRRADATIHAHARRRTGVLHLAVAQGKRAVLMGDATALVKTHPFQHADWTITPPAGQILSSLETGPVIQACSQALNELSRIGPV